MNPKIVLLIMILIVFLAYQFIVKPNVKKESEVYATKFNVGGGTV